MNKLQSLFYFFFPPTDKIFPDGASGAVYKDGKKVSEFHKHYTLRNFAVHYLYTLFLNPFKNAKPKEYLPRLAFGMAQILFSIKFNIGWEIGLGWYVGAIAYDNATGGGNTDVSSITVSHTNTGSNLVLITFGGMDSLTQSFTGVTYNSVAMTAVTSKVHADSNPRIYAFKLAAPATGANNAVFTASGTYNNGSGSVISFTGASQTDIVRESVSASGTSTTPAVTLTAVDATDLCVDGFFIRSASGGSATPGANQTERLDFAIGNRAAGNSTKTGDGSTAFSWTVLNGEWVIIAIAVKVYVATPSTDKFFLMF